MKRICALLVVLYLFEINECKTTNEKFILDDDPIVNTSYGPIRGINDSYAYLYLGIPYATPPIDSLRWEEPLDIKPWSPTLNATSLKAACPQRDCSNVIPESRCPKEISEDCLYLNVFVPKLNTKNKAVMLFIHGGSFQFEGIESRFNDGRYFANNSDVIVVTIQYRLGVLGFLVTGSEDGQTKGNFGILDQRMAIKWVKTNIAAFGGDPNRITLFGQSAGAQSVTIHLLSADMQSQFNNGIIQSSPMSVPFRTLDEALIICTYLEDALNCNARDVKCLKNKTVDEVLTAQMAVEIKLSALKILQYAEPWSPWLDKSIIKAQLLQIEKWNLPPSFTIKPFIISTLTEECYIYIYKGFQKPMDAKIYSALMLAGFKKNFIKLITQYPPDIQTNDQRNLTSAVGTRWLFSCGSRQFIEKAVNLSNSLHANQNYYQSVFNYTMDFQGWGNFSYCYEHVCHGSDLPYTFDSYDANFTAIGRNIARSHMFYWSNFAKYSNPNGESKQFDFWPSYNLNKTYLSFSEPNNRIDNFYSKQDCDFFDSIGYYY